MRDPIIKIGTDIIEIHRFRRRSLKTNMSFYNSVFTKSELLYCLKYSDPYPHFAGIFAAKESIIKCFNRQLRMLDISIDRNENGKPIVIGSWDKNKKVKIEISISHTRSLAVAVAIIIS